LHNRSSARRDAHLIFAAAFVRSSGVGFTGVVLAIYLARRGLSAAALGAVLGAGLIGSATATVLIAVGSDAFGRRRGRWRSLLRSATSR
jgi:MFS family permease